MQMADREKATTQREQKAVIPHGADSYKTHREKTVRRTAQKGEAGEDKKQLTMRAGPGSLSLSLFILLLSSFLFFAKIFSPPYRSSIYRLFPSSITPFVSFPRALRVKLLVSQAVHVYVTCRPRALLLVHGGRQRGLIRAEVVAPSQSSHHGRLARRGRGRVLQLLRALGPDGGSTRVCYV